MRSHYMLCCRDALVHAVRKPARDKRVCVRIADVLPQHRVQSCCRKSWSCDHRSSHPAASVKVAQPCCSLEPAAADGRGARRALLCRACASSVSWDHAYRVVAQPSCETAATRTVNAHAHDDVDAPGRLNHRPPHAAVHHRSARVLPSIPGPCKPAAAIAALRFTTLSKPAPTAGAVLA